MGLHLRTMRAFVDDQDGKATEELPEPKMQIAILEQTEKERQIREIERMKFSKSKAEVYTFTELGNGLWAKFTVEDLGSCGRISIASDFGDWQNGWNACGTSFKQFLCDIGMDYAADKFGADRRFDHAGTIRAYKENVLASRRCSMSKELARELWNEIKDLEDETDKIGFHMLLWNSKELMRYYDGTPELCESVSPHFRRFWKECWPLFTAELKRELAANMVEPSAQ
jgi:hypothetical protein